MKITFEVNAKARGGRGAACKVAIFGLLKRGGKIYTAIIPSAKTETLWPIIELNVQPDRLMYADNIKSYNSLDLSRFNHHRINHSKLFPECDNHINGIRELLEPGKRTFA